MSGTSASGCLMVQKLMRGESHPVTVLMLTIYSHTEIHSVQCNPDVDWHGTV